VQPLVGYIRVSKVKAAAETFRSPDLQRQSMMQWADLKYGKRGHRWVDWFEDLDQSGVTVNRPALGRATECAQANGADIVVFDLSRYSRNVPEGLRALRLLAEKNIAVESASENVDASTSEGELSLTLMLAVNQYQLKKYSENWRHLLAENRRRGSWHGKAPFGYRRAKRGDFPAGTGLVGRIVPDETHARHVQSIFDRYNRGHTIYRIGADAVSEGWFSRIETVRAILENPVYIGKVAEKEYEVARDRTGAERIDSHLRPIRRPKPGGKVTLLPGLHEAIITEDTFDLALARLAREKRGPIQKTNLVRWSASGRTKCASCGRNLYFMDKSHMVPGDARYLVCTKRLCSEKPGSVRVAELEEVLERFIAALPLKIIPRTDELIAGAEQDAKDAAKRRGSLTRKLDKLRSERTATTRILLSGNWPEGLTEDDVRTALETVRAEIDEIDRDLVRLPSHPDVDLAPLHNLKEGVVTLADLWPKLSFERRTEALELLGMTVFIRPRRKHRDSLAGRVFIRSSFELGDLEAVEPVEALRAVGSKKRTVPKKQSRPPKGPRRQSAG